MEMLNKCHTYISSISIWIITYFCRTLWSVLQVLNKIKYECPYIFRAFQQLSDIADFMASQASVGVVWRWKFPWKIAAAMRSNEICFLCLTACRLVYHRRPCQRAAISLGNGTSTETSVAGLSNTLHGKYIQTEWLPNPIWGKKMHFPCFFWSQHIAILRCKNADGWPWPCWKHCSLVYGH